MADLSWLKQNMVIYVDVDDTIIDHRDYPKQYVISALIIAKKQYNCELYLWSQGGAAYAKNTAELLKIDNLFSAFLSKPDICIDDLEITSLFIKHWLHPMEFM